MLNSGKKINILTLVLFEKKILNETKETHILHLQVKWSVPYLVKKLCKNQFQLENLNMLTWTNWYNKSRGRMNPFQDFRSNFPIPSSRCSLVGSNWGRNTTLSTINPSSPVLLFGLCIVVITNFKLYSDRGNSSKCGRFSQSTSLNVLLCYLRTRRCIQSSV